MKKTALVTGASSGIGLEFARLLAADGYDLVIASRDKAELTKIGKELHNSYAIDVKIVAIDLSKKGAADSLWEHTKDTKIDVLINNAGFGDLTDLIDANYENLESMINLNIVCLTRLSQLAAKSMKATGSGHILNIASLLSFFPAPHSAVYGATKSYVLHFSEALSVELEGTGVRVTALCPGPTRTGFAKTAHMEKKSLMQGNIPTGKDVAEYGYKSMKQNKVVAVHGNKTKMIALVAPRFLPRSVMRKIIAKAQS